MIVQQLIQKKFSINIKLDYKYIHVYLNIFSVICLMHRHFYTFLKIVQENSATCNTYYAMLHKIA